MIGEYDDSTQTGLVGYKFWLVLLAVLILCFAALAILMPYASANTLYYGTELNYSAVVLPNNSYVHQGENISQGYWYDLSGVFGFSGVLASWNDESDVGYTLPDHVVSITISPRHIYIDQNKFPVGRWYQLDSYASDDKACSCPDSTALSPIYSSFNHGNNYVFAVVPSQANLALNTTSASATPSQHVYHTTAYVFNGNQSVPIDVTYSVTDTPTLQQPTEQNTPQQKSIEVPTTEQTTEQPTDSGVQIVTPRTPLPTSLAIISIVAGILAWRRKVRRL